MGQQTCTGARLSRAQRAILLALLDYAERRERSGFSTAGGRVAAPLRALRPGGPRSNAQTAAFSRTLITRGNSNDEPSPWQASPRPRPARPRSTHAALTDLGREVAIRLRGGEPRQMLTV
jgi:hypothetical protein